MREISNVILTRGDTILLGWRGPTRRSYPACWAVPGGHLEPEESPESAAIREMHEELGIDVKMLRKHPREAAGRLALSGYGAVRSI